PRPRARLGGGGLALRLGAGADGRRRRARLRHRQQLPGPGRLPDRGDPADGRGHRRGVPGLVRRQEPAEAGVIDRRTLLAAGPALAALPPMAWAAGAPRLFDAHAHLVSDDLANYPRAPQSRPRADEAPTRAEAVLAWMQAAGVDGGACVQHR